MMRFELGLKESDPKRALVSAITIAGAYIAGGLIPLAPYFIVAAAARALAVSVSVTLLALFVFGYVKGHFTRAWPVRSAILKRHPPEFQSLPHVASGPRAPASSKSYLASSCLKIRVPANRLGDGAGRNCERRANVSREATDRGETKLIGSLVTLCQCA
jgi:VIT family